MFYFSLPLLTASGLMNSIWYPSGRFMGYVTPAYRNSSELTLHQVNRNRACLGGAILLLLFWFHSFNPRCWKRKLSRYGFSLIASTSFTFLSHTPCLCVCVRACRAVLMNDINSNAFTCTGISGTENHATPTRFIRSNRRTSIRLMMLICAANIKRLASCPDKHSRFKGLVNQTEGRTNWRFGLETGGSN